MKAPPRAASSDHARSRRPVQPCGPRRRPCRSSRGRPPAVALKTTALVLELPAEVLEQMRRLPFKPRAPGAELARTMKSLVTDPRKGETTPIGDDSIQKAVAVVPFPGNKVGA